MVSMLYVHAKRTGWKIRPWPKSVIFKIKKKDSKIQGLICSGKCPCCRTEIEAAGPTCNLIQLRYTAAGPTRPIADPISPGAWQGSPWITRV